MRLLKGSGSVERGGLNGDLASSRAMFRTFSGAKGAGWPRGSAKALALSKAPLTAASAPARASFRNSLRGVSAITLVFAHPYRRRRSASAMRRSWKRPKIKCLTKPACGGGAGSASLRHCISYSGAGPTPRRTKPVFSIALRTSVIPFGVAPLDLRVRRKR